MLAAHMVPFLFFLEKRGTLINNPKLRRFFQGEQNLFLGGRNALPHNLRHMHTAAKRLPKHAKEVAELSSGELRLKKALLKGLSKARREGDELHCVTLRRGDEGISSCGGKLSKIYP